LKERTILRNLYQLKIQSELHIFGEVTLNKEVLEFLSQNEIILHFYNYYGYYVGSYYPREHYNSGFMILKQAECYLDREKRLELARKFVIGAVQNIEKVLNYYNSRGVNLSQIISNILSLKNYFISKRHRAINGNRRKYKGSLL